MRSQHTQGDRLSKYPHEIGRSADAAAKRLLDNEPTSTDRRATGGSNVIRDEKEKVMILATTTVEDVDPSIVRPGSGSLTDQTGMGIANVARVVIDYVNTG